MNLWNATIWWLLPRPSETILWIGMKTMLKRFERHPEYSGIAAAAAWEYRCQGTFFLEEDYILRLHRELQLFPRTIDAILADAAAIRAEPEAAEYALFVVRAMENRDRFKANLALFTFPEEAHPFFALLCLLPTIPRTHAFLVERKLPEDVIANTLGQFEACIFIYAQRFDHLGLNKRYFDWLQHYVDCEILNINRLRFEILTLEDPIHLLRHRKTGELVLLMGGPEINSGGLYADTPPVEAPAFRAKFRESADCFEGNPVSPRGRCLPEPVCLPKADYQLVLQPGDTCLSVHIPNQGAFTPESCRESYVRAKELFARHFPELVIRAFHCHSWMMAPELEDILKPGSRITAFSSSYLRYPIPTQGEDVLNFVFLLKFKTYQDLPEDTSLRRALKQLYVNGKYLYEYGGIFTV